MHREIRRPESARRSPPGVEANASQHDLQHRRIEPVEYRSLFRFQTRGEGGGVENDIEGPPGEEGAQRLECRIILKAGHENACDREPLFVKRPGQRFDGFEIVSEIDGAIEDDEGARRVRSRLETGRVEATEGADRDRRRNGPRATDLGREKSKASRHIVRAALVKIAPDLEDRVGIECRGLIKAGVAAPIPRQQRQFDVAPARQRPEFIHAVAPIVRPAKEARDHELGARAHPFEMEVDRERMAQRCERSDPERWLRLGKGVIGARERIEVAVRERQEHDVRRRLTQIERFDCLVERPYFDPGDVHRRKDLSGPEG